jgi:hypothetical protein
MSISISGSSPLSSSPIAGAATHNKEAAKTNDAADQNSSQITNQATTTNADGSTTTTITYADGTTSTTTQQASAASPATAKVPSQAQNGQQASGGLLDPTNVAQNAALLAAQEKANSRG